MNKTEVKSWNLLRGHMPGDVSRVENLVDVGTPDVSGAWFKDYWVELKVCPNKEKDRDVLKLLRPEQIVWHYKRGKSGSLIFVFVQYESKFIVYRYFKADEVFPQGRYLKAGTYRKLKGKWEWAKFEHEFEELINEG